LDNEAGHLLVVAEYQGQTLRVERDDMDAVAAMRDVGQITRVDDCGKKCH